MRPIDADNIVQVAEHAYNEWNLAMAAADGRREINHVYKMQELCKAVRAVANAAPTITLDDLIPHGWWEPNGINPHNGVVGNWQCTNCNRVSLNDTNYCPNCGSKMDGGGEDFDQDRQENS